MNAIQFQFQFDIQRILEELQAIRASFTPIHSLRIKKDQLNGIHLINPLPDGQKNESGYTYSSTPQLDQSPYLKSILDSFPCDKFIYRVHNLRAKGKIELHRDSDRGLINGIVRIHIPVTSNEEVYFYVNGERVCMRNGECWFADITQMHEVENRSDTDRLQLMIDCNLNDWWKNTLAEHGLQLEGLSEWANFTLEQLQQMKENFLKTSKDQNLVVLKKIEQAIATKNLIS